MLNQMLRIKTLFSIIFIKHKILNRRKKIRKFKNPTVGPPLRWNKNMENLKPKPRKKKNKNNLKKKNKVDKN